MAASTLSKVVLSNGTPTGVWGDFNTYLQSSIYADGVNASNGSAAQWELSFNDVPVLSWKYQKCKVDDDACHFAVAASSFDDCKDYSGSTPTSGRRAPDWTGFTAVVPEPGSLALMLPALGAFAFVRRRKDKAARVVHG